jgi:NTE family protein
MDDRGATHNLPGLLGEDAWTALTRHMVTRAFQPGDTIVERGELAPDFHVIDTGAAAVIASTAHGERRELGRLGPGDCVGEMSLLTGEPASADVVAVTPVKAFGASQQLIGDLGELRLGLISALSTILASRLKHANERLLSRRAANIVTICGSADDVATLSGLPAAVADITREQIVVVVASDVLTDAVRTIVGDAKGVSVQAVPQSEPLVPVLDHITRQHQHVIVVGDESSQLETDAPESAVYHLVRLDGARVETPPHAAGGGVIAIGPAPWTVPGVRELSERTGRKVAAIVNPGNGDMQRVARVLTRRTVGVAFGAGAAKGLAHLGVLRAFQEMGVPIDAVSGASIGAAVAAGVAARTPVDELEELVNRVAARVVRPAVPVYSLLSNAGIKEEIHRAAGETRIEDLDLPLAIVAVDIFRRAEVTFTSGLVWPRIVASTAIPGVYPATAALGSFLVDGGILTPVPARQCRELGADIVIGVRLTATRTSPRERLDRQPGKPLAVEAMIRAFEIMQNRISEISHEPSDVTIEVSVEGTGGLRDFKRGAEIALVGHRAARGAADALTEAIPYLKGVRA